MANPSKPDLDYSYTGFQASQGDNSFPGTPLDNDLANLKQSIDETIDALGEVRRSDGALTNEIVTFDSLDAALKAKFQAGGAGSATPVDPIKVYAGPSSGPAALPTFRPLIKTDLPTLLQGGASAIPISLYDRAADRPQFVDYTAGGGLQKNIAALRGIIPTQDKAEILVQDWALPGVGGGGFFRWDAASSTADDSVMTVQPNDNAGPGRWKRIVQTNGRVMAKWCGAIGDGVTDDTVALQRMIDVGKATGRGAELDIGDYLTGPLKGNGSTWTPADNVGQQTSTLCFVGGGRSPFHCRLIAKSGKYGVDNPEGLAAVLTFRNISGVVVTNFQIDAAGVADTCGDFEWMGGTSEFDATAPSCHNEFSHLWGENARRLGWNLDQAADCLIQFILYRGGTASIGISMKLGGGWIGANNLAIGSGKLRLASQNAGIQNSVFFSGVEIAGPAINNNHFDACHFYAYTPRRTLPLNSFATVNGDATVTVTMIDHGLLDGNFVEFSGCVTTNGIPASELNTTAARPRPITWLSADTFSVEAGHWDELAEPDPVFVPVTATSTGAGGGSTVLATGRGWAIHSSAANGDSPRGLKVTAGYFNSLGVAGQRFFAGRWMNGAIFETTRFGNNSGEPTKAGIYFDDAHWTPAGALSTLPVFQFNGCGFSYKRPESIAGKVLVGFNNYYQGFDNTSVAIVEHPGSFVLPQNAYNVAVKFGSLSLWNDGAGHIRVKNTTAPSSATDGNILVERQSGTASPLNSVTPSHVGAIFTDGTNARVYQAYNTTSAHWFEPARLRTGTASPVSANTPTRVGEIFVDTTNSRVYVSYGTGITNWYDVTPPTATDSISAAGTTQGAATALTANLNNVTTVVAASADGVRLPTAVIGMSVVVWNNDASGSDTLNVYPATGATINALAANTATTIAAGANKTFRALSATKWLTL